MLVDFIETISLFLTAVAALRLPQVLVDYFSAHGWLYLIAAMSALLVMLALLPVAVRARTRTDSRFDDFDETI